MELALESYDVCTGLLQSKPKTAEVKHYTINLPNLRVDAAISVEEVIKQFLCSYSPSFLYCETLEKQPLLSQWSNSYCVEL